MPTGAAGCLGEDYRGEALDWKVLACRGFGGSVIVCSEE
jgi:hypothetical protein